jgi:predicted HicB family RNase H-like nuclease
MKIDRSQESALEVVKSNAKAKTQDSKEQKLSEEFLKIGFENQFQKNELTRIRNLINDSLDEFLRNHG